MAALYPEDFQGAAPGGVDIICLSSDEEKDGFREEHEFSARPSIVIG